MGKSSKSKGKKFAKQERVMHLKSVEVWQKTMSTIGKKLSNVGIEKRRERVRLLKEQLELTLNIEESFAFVNRYQSYKNGLSVVCSELLYEQIILADYVEASNTYNDMMKYPLTDEDRILIKPFSSFFLLWTERENTDREETIANIAENAFDIIHRPEARYPFHFLFIHKALTELSRQNLSRQQFKRVESLSLVLSINNNVCEHEFQSNWLTMAQTFLVYSNIDKVRFTLHRIQERIKILAFLVKVRQITTPLLNKLPLRTWCLAYSLLEFYTLPFHLLEKAKQYAKKCIESLEKYIALSTRAAQNVCWTCKDDHTQEHESLVCQGCRVVS